MATIEADGMTFRVDGQGFLLDLSTWDPAFAVATAARLGMEGGLTEPHWSVLRYVQESFRARGRCPLVYEVCRAQGLRLSDLRRLFPSGYLRGVCKLAGLAYRDSWIPHEVAKGTGSPDSPTASYVEGWRAGSTTLWPGDLEGKDKPTRPAEKVYRVDIAGFLVDPAEWNAEFARARAAELQPEVELSDEHWRILGYLRGAHAHSGQVPTIYETCESNGIELEELERLFPSGYHRGAVKIAGLRDH